MLQHLSLTFPHRQPPLLLLLPNDHHLSIPGQPLEDWKKICGHHEIEENKKNQDKAPAGHPVLSFL